MKNVIFLILFSLISIMGNSQEINKKQWTLFSKTSADWCTLCGGWGWELHKQLISNLESKNTIIWALHTSTSGLTNNASKDIITNLGGSGQPRFFESQTNMNAGPTNIAAKVEEAKSIVDLNQILDPVAGIGLTATLDANKTLKVSADVQFLSAAENGNYFLGLYLVEDKLVHPQANQGNNAVHRYVLRSSLLPTSFGENFASGAIAKDTKFNVQATMNNVTANPDNLLVAAIIWNRTSDGKYRFFNANMEEVSLSSSSENQAIVQSVSAVFQQDMLHIALQNDLVIPSIKIQLVDMTGKNLYYTEISQVSSWEKTLSMPLPSGTYILNFDAGALGNFSKKLVKI